MTMPAQNARLVCLGAITGSRGLKGEVRIKSFTADPDDIGAYGPLLDKEGKQTFEFKVVGSAKGQLIARIDGVNDRSAADALKGTELYIERSALPEPEDDEFYHQDLIGLRVRLKDGSDVGTVKSIEDYGAGTLLEIETAMERGDIAPVFMVPFTREAVPEVDLKAGLIVIDPPPGIMEPPKADEQAGEQELDENEDNERG